MRFDARASQFHHKSKSPVLFRMLTKAVPFHLCLLIMISAANCDKTIRVVEEFDSAHVSKHYQVTFMGMEILSLRSKPVLSLVKEQDDTGDHNDQEELASELFSLDWEKWWSERGEPLFEALKQNPQFVAAVCFMVAVVRGLRQSVIRETVDTDSLVEQITEILSAQSLETRQQMENLAVEVQQVTKNQDVIARAFARVISILRDTDRDLESE
jgi:hypothetical protein